MSLPITTAIVEGHRTGSASMAHVFGRPLAEPPVSQTTPIVFVIDEDVLIRESLERLIRSQGWRSETFASAEEFLSVPRASVPCCLILDVSFSGPSGLELQKRFAIEERHAPIIFVTRHVDVRVTVQAMKAGAVEFLTKPLRQDLLLSALREAISRSRSLLGQEAEMQTLRDRYDSLTRREQQVLALVVSGLLNKQVGWELAISEQTVKTHRGQVMQKMKAESFAGLVKMGTKLGIAAAPRA